MKGENLLIKVKSLLTKNIYFPFTCNHKRELIILTGSYGFFVFILFSYCYILKKIGLDKRNGFALRSQCTSKC